MPLDLLPACIFTGPALPEPFVRLELEQALVKAGLLPKATGAEGKALQESWERYERKLRELVVRGGPERVFNHVFQPLVERLGYARVEDGGTVRTSLESEDGGQVLMAEDGTKLRVWITDLEADLDAPGRRGAASRYSPLKVAQRVLLAERERVGLLTNGVELRLLISDPARTDSQVIIPIDTQWRRHYRAAPDSYRLLLALASPAGLRKLPELIEQARQQQTRVTNDLRRQAREAIEGFIQAILDGAENQERITAYGDRAALARHLWREGLVIVYRLLVILKLAASDDPARRFSFADSSIWRLTYAPGTALAPIARAVLDEGHETGRLLEDGLCQLFRLFAEGVESQELTVKPLAGGLFDPAATPTLAELRWGERAVALLLDRLLWTPRGKGGSARERVSYAALDVEDLGRVYEALLELEPGIAAEPMCRLRRQKLEVVVSLAQGEKYRAVAPAAAPVDDADTADADEEEDDETPARGKKTKVEWIEAIAPGRFYLRVGLGRKSSGSYYTPRSFVRFLVQETVGPQCAERSTMDEPQPGRILALRLLDPAMGSGHFLVEACRFLGDRLYDACHRCDELASEAEAATARATDPAEAERLKAHAEELRRRVEALPDPDNALVAYLPSRAREGDLPGLSEQKARALCRRLAAVHCIYGVDKNPLAVALARVALWIESHAEGLPLTFLDHRLVLGDSLTGPFAEHLFRYPGSQKPLDDLFNQGLQARLGEQLADALRHVAALEESVGIDVADIERKRAAKEQLDGALAPFRLLAAAWAGGVMLGKQGCDDEAYAMLARWVAGVPEGDDDTMPESLRRMVARGLGLRELPAQVISVGDAMVLLLGPSVRVPDWLRSAGVENMTPALPYDLTFPEVFYPAGKSGERAGFDVVVGNPPWDRMLPADKEFFASYEFAVLDAPTKREREAIERRITSNPEAAVAHTQYIEEFRGAERSIEALYRYQIVEIDGEKTIGKQDAFRAFMERNAQVLGPSGLTGVVVPSAFHANEGATGVRRLYFEQMATRCCFSFENKRKIFDIHSSFKFVPIVAAREGPTTEFPCGFYLHDDSWLFERNGHEPLRYSLDFVQRTGGDYLSLLELRSSEDAEVARICFANGEPFGKVCELLGIRLGRELNMTDDAWRFTSTSEVLPDGEDPRDPDIAIKLQVRGYFVLHEGKTFHHFTDKWDVRPQYLLSIQKIDRESWLRVASTWRIVLRKVASSTNERTFVITLLPPGTLTSDSVFADQESSNHSIASSLFLLSVCCSFAYDFVTRQMVSVNVNLFIANRLPVPRSVLIPDTRYLKPFLSHSALRLTCNHAGYAALWREQVGEAWREERAPFDWPVLAGDDARWAVRVAIDAVIAEAYGLSREQYAHVLSTFSHKSYPKAPELCLAALDELKELGLEAFAKKHDPYWDIPLNERLPQPVIDLPLPTADGRPQTAGARRGRRGAALSEEALIYASPQLTLKLGEEPAPAQQVIDFEAAAAARRQPMRKAAEGRAGYDAGEAARYERVKALLEERGQLTSGEVQFALGVDAAAARALLRRLVDEGLARQEGEKRGTRYVRV